MHQSKSEAAGRLTKLLDEKEVAALLGVKPTCLQNWRWKGGGPKFLRVGRLCKYREEDVLVWLEARTCANTSQEVA